jgi:prepilin-type N-terminal cleavage/methylation domain-containing protein
VKRNNQKGFTLIELMVVVAIVSLITSIITYSTSEAKVKAEDSKMIQEAQQVEKAIQLYKENNEGKVPGAVIFAGGVGGGVMGQMYKESDPQYDLAMQELVDKKIYPKIPRSPSGQSYAYMVSLDGESAVFSAILKKPISGGGSGGSSGKNQCDIVATSRPPRGGTETPSPVFCARQDMGFVLTCPEVTYDSNLQTCFYITEAEIDQKCVVDSVSGACSSTNEAVFPSYLCSIYSYGCGGNWGFSSGGGYLGTYLCDNPVVEEDLTPSVCSGLSDKDYCACI